MAIEYDFANLTGGYNLGAGLLTNAIDGMAEADWLSRQNESTTLFIVGHMAVTQGVALNLFGVRWPGSCGRGAVLVAAEEVPIGHGRWGGWEEVVRLLPESLDRVAAGQQGISSFDGN